MKSGFFEQLASQRKVLVFGHRGFSQDYPENTMVSFSRCAENPLIDAVELDVHLCSSGEVVVAHDFSLKRTAGLDREIEDLTFDELKSVDVGSFKGPQFSDQRVPLLSELFSSFGSRFYYDIELKVKAGKVNRELSRKVLGLIDDYGLRSRVLVSSFNPFALRAFNSVSRSAFPSADIFEHSENIPKPLWDGAGHIISRATYQKPGFRQVDASYLRRHGSLPIITWTVNERSEAERLLSLNSDPEDGKMKVFGLIGNDPDMLADVVSHWKV